MSTSQKTDCGCGGSSPSPASKTACGCGGSSPTSATKTACGCGGKGCGQCGHGSFARPRFFAGQLLTEEDLGLLEQYVVGKNRLRNRYLTGEGVVCGLEVLCPPCGGRQVRVRPGYAIDCCGNDILVPCEVAVDVIEMIRQLRLRTLDGWDCGEPCLEEMPKQAPEQKQAQKQAQEQPKDIREYTLVLRYTESHTDPVLPYATGDACGPDQGCQPTRIQEGYCLELRCAKGPAPLADVRQRFLECLGEMPELTEEPGQGEEASPEDDEGPQFEGVLSQVMVRLKESRKLGDKAAAAREIAELILPLDPRRSDFAQCVEALQTFQKTLKSGLYAELQATINDLAAKGAEAGEPKAGQVAAPADCKKINEIKAWLQDRLTHRPNWTDCELSNEIACLVCPEPATAEEAARLLRKARHLALRVVIDCLCQALLPPCPPCNDLDVPLASIRVQDCKVVSVCNLNRRMVISGPALRYWVPYLERGQELLRTICCIFPRKLGGQSCPDQDAFGLLESLLDWVKPEKGKVAEPDLEVTGKLDQLLRWFKTELACSEQGEQ